jgi:hypothetical protein
LEDITVKNEAMIGYSGGIDSTVAAAKLGEQYDKVHLNTYIPGTLILIKQSKKNAKRLRETLGEDRIQHNIINIKPICGQIRKGFSKDYFNYFKGDAPAMFCMACKLGMHTHNVIYCLENGVPYPMDGSVRTQASHPEMMPGVLNVISQFYAEYNLRFKTPVYDFGSKDEELEYLRDRGFKLGPVFGESDYRTIQPVCLLGPFYTVWHLWKPNSQEQVIPFLRDKLPISRDYIKAYFEKKGMDVEELKAQFPEVKSVEITHYDDDLDHVHLMGVFGGTKDKILGNVLRPLWWCFRQAFRIGAKFSRS